MKSGVARFLSSTVLIVDANTAMSPRPMIAAKLNLILIFICRFRMIRMGNRARTRSLREENAIIC